MTSARTITPTPDVDLDRLTQALGTEGTLALTLPEGTSIPLPDALADALRSAAQMMASGFAVEIRTLGPAMTTQEAAEFLDISRPTLIKLLDAGNIPFTRPGKHRRIQLGDLITYRESIHAPTDSAVEARLRTEVIATLRELEANPSAALTSDQMRARQERRRDTATKVEPVAQT